MFDFNDCHTALREPTTMIKAYPQQTPHSGRHFVPSHRAYQKKKRKWLLWQHAQRLRRRWLRQQERFTEGWYYRLTLPDAGVSFAFIVSIEDPYSCSSVSSNNSDLSPHRLACIQIIGPDDTYLVQATRDDTAFWAWRHVQALGCTFQYHENEKNVTTSSTTTTTPTTALNRQEFESTVKSGFQILPNHLVGVINGRDGADVLSPDQYDTNVATCRFDFAVDPVVGWGDNRGADNSDNNNDVSEPQQQQQKSTGGWISRFDLFEPHWQVTMADARASGHVVWQNKTYTFSNAPFYAEKNWGQSLPSKYGSVYHLSLSLRLLLLLLFATPRFRPMILIF